MAREPLPVFVFVYRRQSGYLPSAAAAAAPLPFLFIPPFAVIRSASLTSLKDDWLWGGVGGGGAAEEGMACINRGSL